MAEKQIHVFIVEDEAQAKEMIERYFKPKGGGITFAQIFPADQRKAVADAIGAVDDSE